MKITNIIILAIGFMSAQIVDAATWRFDPRISVSETYTDNVFLSESNESDDFITDITPGIRITGTGRYLQLDFDYQYQSLIYADDSSLNDEFTQLRGTMTSELIEGHLFLEADANIGQANISTLGRTSSNNLNVTGNRTDTSTYRISPIYRHSLAGLIDAELQYTYAKVNVDAGAGDSESDQYSVRLNNGRKFNRFRWSIDYQNSQSDRSNLTNNTTNSKTRFESYEGNVTFPITRKFSGIVEAGKENNNFNSSRDRRDGDFVSAGVGYQPSRRLLLEIVGGDRDRFTLNWQPSQRTDLQFTFRSQNFGANSGDTVNARFEHRTRRSNWQLSYIDETTTTQDVLLNDRASVLLDNNGDPVLDPLTNDPIIITPDGLNLRDDVFNRRRLNASVTYNTGKSTIRAQLFTEMRDSEEVGSSEKGVGTNLTWTWQLASRTESIVSANWRRDESDNQNESDQFDFGINLIRRVSPRTIANLNLRHVDRDTDNGNTNNLFSGYEENTISAGIRATF